jgi:hypothetical protein
MVKWAACALAFAWVGCGGESLDAPMDPTGDVDGKADSAGRHHARDWSKYPAIVEVDDADEVFALSDPHGHIDVLRGLLLQNALIDGRDRWVAGDAILVVAGDLIDKGPRSLEVIDFLRALQASAAKAGGRLITTIGNHEAEFFVDPFNNKALSDQPNAEGIDIELDARRIDPDSLAQRHDVKGRGAWLYNLPFGVRIKKWFFSHSGNTKGRSIKHLMAQLQSGLDEHGFGDKELTGDNSILEAQKWYGDPDKDSAGKDAAAALGVDHIVFGHDPGAMHTRGQVETSKNGVLIKLDCDLGDGVRGGNLLHVFTKGKDAAEALDADGHRRPLDI